MTGTVALLYDVHGNLPALEAVLQDAVGAGATAGVFGGDAASFGAWPAETVDTLLACPVPLAWLRGNWDRWLASFPPADLPANPVVPGAARFALDRLDGATVARLGALPTDVVVGSTRCVHASPGDDMAGIPLGGRPGRRREARRRPGGAPRHRAHARPVRPPDAGGRPRDRDRQPRQRRAALRR